MKIKKIKIATISKLTKLGLQKLRYLRNEFSKTINGALLGERKRKRLQESDMMLNNPGKRLKMERIDEELNDLTDVLDHKLLIASQTPLPDASSSDSDSCDKSSGRKSYEIFRTDCRS